MSGIKNKFKDFFGIETTDEEYDEDYNEDEMEEEEIDEVEPIIPKNRNNNKVVNIHTAASAKVMIIKPSCYEEAAEICDALRNRKIIVVNTSALEHKIAQRLLDFISGSCYALSGELQEIEMGVYILSPSNVEVSNELKTELSTKGIFGWSK